MAIPPGGTPLDIAALINRVLKRNINWPFRAVADGATAITVLDHYLTVDATLGDATLTLPSAITAKKGMPFEIMRIDSALANTVALATVLGQTINGAAGASIGLQYSALVVVSDGANWLLYASPAAYALSSDVLWTFPGQLASDQNSSLFELKAKRAMAFVAFDADARTAPTGNDIIVDWAVNGVVEPTYRVTIPAGSTYAQTVVAAALAVDDLLRPVIVQVGSSTPGDTMVMRARGT